MGRGLTGAPLGLILNLNKVRDANKVRAGWAY
jgi:hypothetical protein